MERKSTNAGVLLPGIQRIRVEGFDPLFTGPVDLSIHSGLNVLLGGNGLGKTTLLQCLVYGLTGGLDETVSEEKALRWNHHYFKGRYVKEKNAAFVEVHFKLGQHHLAVRRGFSSPRVTHFRVGNHDKWVTETETAAAEFSSSIMLFGRYKTLADFCFLVHRLVYMPETRQLLAWDINSQTRLVMLLSSDSIDEHAFRAKRAELKNLDSMKRHLQVTINKLISSADTETASKAPIPASGPQNHLHSVRDTVREIAQISKARQRAEKALAIAAQKLSKVSAEVESLRESVAHEEAVILTASLSVHEKALHLPLHSLVHSGACPACGTISRRLQDLARKYSEAHRCRLCGDKQSTATTREFETLQSQLAAKTRAQFQLGQHLTAYQNQVAAFRSREQALFSRINSAQIAKHQATVLLERPQDMGERSTPNLEEMQRRHANLEAQCLEIERALESQYASFQEGVSNRTSKLRALYATYATAFLGIECQLVETEADDRFLNLRLFIPQFKGIPRATPESCSEAQRFFLDIAFRMALIDLFSETAGEPGTFICETPENALDMSYVSNVSSMFSNFIKKDHTLILTANIQKQGMARELFKTVPRAEKRKRLFNMLEFGRLSNVQLKEQRRLGIAVKAILH